MTKYRIFIKANIYPQNEDCNTNDSFVIFIPEHITYDTKQKAYINANHKTKTFRSHRIAAKKMDLLHEIGLPYEIVQKLVLMEGTQKVNKANLSLLGKPMWTGTIEELSNKQTLLNKSVCACHIKGLFRNKIQIIIEDGGLFNGFVIGTPGSGKCHHSWDNLKPCLCGCKERPLLMYEKNELYYCGGPTESTFAICSVCGRHTEPASLTDAILKWNNDEIKERYKICKI